MILDLQKICKNSADSPCIPIALNWGWFCPSRGHLQIYEDILVGHNLGAEGGSANGIWWVEARGAAKPIVHKTGPHDKELSSPLCQ